MSKHALTRIGLPVDGVERATAEGWTFPARSPATGEVLWDVPDAGVVDAHAAAQAAWRAFHETTWSSDRACLLMKATPSRDRTVEHHPVVWADPVRCD